MQTFLLYAVISICPALLVFIIFLRYKLNAAHKMLKHFAEERITLAERNRKKKAEKIAAAYSIECLELLDDKIYDIQIEQLSAQMNLDALSYTLNALGKDHNSRIIYYTFLNEAVAIMETSNIQLADVIERFSAIHPDECVN